MTSGSFIKVHVDDLQDAFADYYKDYNDVCLYPSIYNSLMLDYELGEGETYTIELTPHVTGLKQVVLDVYNFHFNDYIVVEDWVYFFKEDFGINGGK